MQPTRQVAVTPATARHTPALCATDSFHCLVVAADASRRENLGFAAREGGWEVTLCPDPVTAVARARHKLMHMAIVDLTGTSEGATGLRAMVEQLASTSRMLLLVCGNLDDHGEEVWARHLGVWMYLPGAIDGTDMVALCGAARHTAERLVAASRQRAPSGRAARER